ncbi:uncharacterized protein LOC126859002 isoform X1 [Cataglyphis hispanica]|uniref:uncharacterized protein LOC126859002 isoform X1 n=1 Tax=Cataglyphis hispanica TaxID=1086592 RepID=UPI00217FF75A|nr:uncharacterized protein LOC126859002 isoform X1 [Cataglyphis hispanica]
MQNEREITEEQDSSGTNTESCPKEKQIETLSSYQKSYCQLRYEANTIDYVWKLDRCSKLLKFLKPILSMPFPESTSQYVIQIEVSIASEWSSSLVKFYLLTKVSFNGTCDVFIIDKYSKIHVNSICGVLSNMTLLYETTVKTLCDDLDKDTLTMGFTFEILYRYLIDTMHIEALPLSKLSLTYSNSQNSTLDDIPDGTITFVLNGKYYDVSKKLLHNTKCVEYFCSTYKENMTNDLITINDNDMQDVFHIMLMYLKTGLILGEFDYYKIKKLLEVAHKCDLQNLKLICEEYLIRTITIDSVIELVQLAFLNNAKNLEKHAATFIKFNIQEIINIKEFLSLPQEHLDKIIELVAKIQTLKFDTETLFEPS